MCGIFGFVGKGSWKSSVLLQSLCIADEVRGRHSTGLVIQSGSNCFLQKKAVDGKEFVSRGYTSFLFKNEYSLALGHNRYATAGAVNDRNAHPFGMRVNGGWCFGVHNGMVGGVERIVSEYGIKEPQVDSEAVFRAIAKMQNQGISVPDAIENITEFISAEADFAFAYLNTSEKAIYLWRSPERPLCIIEAKRLHLGRWFCSTPDIFKSAWFPLAGALGDISNLSRFEAQPYRLYRIVDDGVFEVEPIRDLKYRERKTDTSEELRSYPSFYTSDSLYHYDESGQMNLLPGENKKSDKQKNLDYSYLSQKEFLWEFSDDELYREIFRIEAYVDIALNNDERLQLSRYLTELHAEKERRQGQEVEYGV